VATANVISAGGTVRGGLGDRARRYVAGSSAGCFSAPVGLLRMSLVRTGEKRRGSEDNKYE